MRNENGEYDPPLPSNCDNCKMLCCKANRWLPAVKDGAMKYRRLSYLLPHSVASPISVLLPLGLWDTHKYINTQSQTLCRGYVGVGRPLPRVTEWRWQTHPPIRCKTPRRESVMRWGGCATRMCVASVARGGSQVGKGKPTIPMTRPYQTDVMVKVDVKNVGNP